jgi:hypothetical protein
MKHIFKTTEAMLVFTSVLIVNSPLCSIAADTNAPELAIETRAQRIVLPEFRLDNVTFTQAVRRLLASAFQQDQDIRKTDPGKEFGAIIKPGISATNLMVTLALKNVTVEKAAEQLAKQAGVRVSMEGAAFVFSPKSDKP